MTVLRSERLLLRMLAPADAEFVHRLMNDEAWLAKIGDRGIRTLDDARRYLLEGPWTRYAEFGFGFYAVELKAGSGPLGVCGLAKRPHLDHPDLGFALLPEHRGAGYAYEAAQAVLAFAVTSSLKRVVATTRPGNAVARNLLNRLGMRTSGSLISPTSGQPLLMYSLDLTAGGDAS